MNKFLDILIFFFFAFLVMKTSGILFFGPEFYFLARNFILFFSEFYFFIYLYFNI